MSSRIKYYEKMGYSKEKAKQLAEEESYWENPSKLARKRSK